MKEVHSLNPIKYVIQREFDLNVYYIKQKFGSVLKEQVSPSIVWLETATTRKQNALHPHKSHV